MWYGGCWHGGCWYVSRDSPISPDHTHVFYLILTRLISLTRDRYCVMLSAFLITIIVCVYNKISPYGLYGRKMHALMTCRCEVCKIRQRKAKVRYIN